MNTKLVYACCDCHEVLPGPTRGDHVCGLPAKAVAQVSEPTWVARYYTGDDWPTIKGPGIELECAGGTREQAKKIAAVLNQHLPTVEG